MLWKTLVPTKSSLFASNASKRSNIPAHYFPIRIGIFTLSMFLGIFAVFLVDTSISKFSSSSRLYAIQILNIVYIVVNLILIISALKIPINTS